MNSKADIGLVGLAVMGENLVLNMESKGYTVAVYNRTFERVDKFLNDRGKGKRLIGAHSVKDFVAVLKRPRKIILLVKAGQPVDDFIDALLPHLDAGDIIIDGGNTLFEDTERRLQKVETAGMLYVGSGVSGGEEGALLGPSIMPGGSVAAWPLIQELFQNISAKAADKAPCCEWIGGGGAGHFVKTIHNGIEYGEMQLIGETYHLLKQRLGMSADGLHRVFDKWKQGPLSGYLTEITADIFAYKEADGQPLIDRILDAAGQKGTGKWSCRAAMDAGVPLTVINEAVFARCLSALKDLRKTAAGLLPGPQAKEGADAEAFLADLESALYGAKLVSYAQGFALMESMSQLKNWGMDLGSIARIWRGGCIIRSAFLDKITAAYRRQPELENLLLDPYFEKELQRVQAGWRRVVADGVTHGIPLPAMSAALAYYDGLRSEWLPANLLQAQRDYFGAHLFERIDRPRGEFCHANWTGRGGETVSSAYEV